MKGCLNMRWGRDARKLELIELQLELPSSDKIQNSVLGPQIDHTVVCLTLSCAQCLCDSEKHRGGPGCHVFVFELLLGSNDTTWVDEYMSRVPVPALQYHSDGLMQFLNRFFLNKFHRSTN